MNSLKKLYFVFFIFLVSIMTTGCFGEIDSTGLVEADAIAEVEEIEINTESSDVERSSSREVVIENGVFNPPDVVVSVGDTVEWVNLDYTNDGSTVEWQSEIKQVDHTISFEDGRFDVEIPYGASVTYTFVEIGEARYFSKFYPDARGSVLVE
jgi:plastocyanin